MNVILGVSGRVGSRIVDFLLQKKAPVRGVIRNAGKADELKRIGADVRIADYYDLNALKESVKGGSVVFVLTPEPPDSTDILGDTRKLVENYRQAVESSQVKKIIGLSSIGADLEGDTGNLQMSNILEHGFEGLPVQKIFIRPAYYFSNWLYSLPVIKENGVLPTFFPPDFKFPMASPIDVAEFISDIIVDDNKDSLIYEIEGPESYSSADVAKAFSELLPGKIEIQQIPKADWKNTLLQSGFTNNVADNFIKMTETLINSNTSARKDGTTVVKLKTTLKEYLSKSM
jgi:uncharacterized protein YbjT (DUF2867 family)